MLPRSTRSAQSTQGSKDAHLHTATFSPSRDNAHSRNHSSKNHATAHNPPGVGGRKGDDKGDAITAGLVSPGALFEAARTGRKVTHMPEVYLGGLAAALQRHGLASL